MSCLIRGGIVRVVKTKALISFAVTAKLVCALVFAYVFAYAVCCFSHAAALKLRSVCDYSFAVSDILVEFIYTAVEKIHVLAITTLTVATEILSRKTNLRVGVAGKFKDKPIPKWITWR